MSFGPGMACVTCSTLLRPRKNEIYVLITDGDNPYQIWMADLWECPDCGQQIAAGYGRQPVSVRHMDNFESEMKNVTHTISGKMRSLS